ncbi:MAG: peroxiredoxin family protein [Thermodesulfobacteriota bacterium]
MGLGKIKKIFLFVILALTLPFLGFPSNKPPGKGEPFPPISLPIPKNPSEKSYLGLSGDGLFKIPQIKTKVLIIEIFSMYCPHCQKDAPGVNELYDRIERNQDLKGKIKLIGIGVGNTPFEVEMFKKTYQIPFPLFSDRDYTLHKAFGEVRTPYFMIGKIKEDGTSEIVHTQLGGYLGAEAFLELAQKVSGLK